MHVDLQKIHLNKEREKEEIHPNQRYQLLLTQTYYLASESVEIPKRLLNSLEILSCIPHWCFIPYPALKIYCDTIHSTPLQ